MHAHSYEPWTDTTTTKLWNYFTRRKKKSSQKSKSPGSRCGSTRGRFLLAPPIYHTIDNVPCHRDGSSHPPIGIEASILNHISDEAKAEGSRHGLGPLRVYDHGCVISTLHQSICGGVTPPCTQFSIRTRRTISIYSRTMVQPHWGG
jgi:hypothetical protein